MSETVITNVTMVSKNEVTDGEKEQIMDNSDFNSFEEYAKSLEETVEGIVAKQFGDADEIPILDVNVEVDE